MKVPRLLHRPRLGPDGRVCGGGVEAMFFLLTSPSLHAMVGGAGGGLTR
jgi:hypothetical protein